MAKPCKAHAGFLLSSQSAAPNTFPQNLDHSLPDFLHRPPGSYSRPGPEAICQASGSGSVCVPPSPPPGVLFFYKLEACDPEALGLSLTPEGLRQVCPCLRASSISNSLTHEPQARKVQRRGGLCLGGRNLLEGGYAHFTAPNAMARAGRPNGPFVSIFVCVCVGVEGRVKDGVRGKMGKRTAYTRESFLPV